MSSVEQMKKILIKNINSQLSKRRITQTDMARDLGFPETTVSNWMKGATYPRPDRIQMMADYFNVSRVDLTEERPTNIQQISQQTVKIPILGPIACGDPILVEENYEDYKVELKEALPHGDLFFLNAKGDSMSPTIPDGSLVLIRHQKDVESGEIAAVMFNGNTEATLKRIKKQDGLIMLVPDNNKYEIIVASRENPIEIIGKAVEIRTIL